MICGVLGDPIAHSLSPLLHRAAYDACGLDWEYDAHRVPAGGLAAFVDGLDASWRGLSVTAPLKREAASRADEVSPTVVRAGVANTLVHADDRWYADNTDVPGAAAAIRGLVRDPSRAAEAVASLGRHPAEPVVEVLSLHDDAVVGEVVVSTIPAAAQTDDVVERCADVPVVFEVVYHPWPTPLARSVLDRGLSGAGR